MIGTCKMCELGQVETIMEFNSPDKKTDYVLGACQYCGTIYKKDKSGSKDLNMLLPDNTLLVTAS
jgi:hypothetical protein